MDYLVRFTCHFGYRIEAEDEKQAEALAYQQFLEEQENDVLDRYDECEVTPFNAEVDEGVSENGKV